MWSQDNFCVSYLLCYLRRRKVSEFGEKKDVARVLEQKELKVAGLTQEVNGLRSQVRSKDRIIFGFKRELSSMVHISLPKDLEQAVKVLHSTKYIVPLTPENIHGRSVCTRWHPFHFLLSSW